MSISKNKQYFRYSLDRVWIIKQLHTQKSILTSQYYTLVFEPPDSEGFILPEEVISPPLAKDTPHPTPSVLISPTLHEEINPSVSLFLESVVTFPEGDVRQDNTDIPQGP